LKDIAREYTSTYSVCLNIVLRDKGLEDEEVVPWEEAFEFICCVCATTGESIILSNVLVTTIIATTNRRAISPANRFIIGVT
jgi:hypothetical protein